MAACGLCKVGQEKPWVAKWDEEFPDVFHLKPWGTVIEGHRIFCPKEHVVDAAEDFNVTGQCFAAAAKYGAEQGVPFNLVTNCGRAAGQGTFHLHIHYVPRKQGDGHGYRWKPEKKNT